MTFTDYIKTEEVLRPYLPNSYRKLGHKADGAIAVRQRVDVQADWTWEDVFTQDISARNAIRYAGGQGPL